MTKVNVSKMNDEMFSKPLQVTKRRKISNSSFQYLHKPYKIVIADDDEEVHHVTKMIFKGFLFEGHPLEIIDTYSATQTVKIFQTTTDIAVLFLDVVMEKDYSGLDVVRTIRGELSNHAVRIVLRTGHPGEAPEEEVIRDYDINDYRLKTELTANRLKTTLYSALRNFRDIQSLEKHKSGLEKIIKTTSKLFENNTLKDFLTSMLEELSNFQHDNPEMLYVRGESSDLNNGFVTVRERKRNMIVAATGKYEDYIGKDIESIPELSHLKKWMKENTGEKIIHRLSEGFIIESRGKSQLNNFIFIEGDWETFDFELIQLFLSNFSVALDNFILSNLLNSTQRDVLIALGETIECHFEETGNHVKRISEMMYQFALCSGTPLPECEMLKIASSMHDLGKIAIPDAILKKPGKLTPEEFEIIKAHSMQGYRILCKSNVPLLTLAAEIALNHHEKYDGSGYPSQLSGKNIPQNARMMAIVDVFDAMTHKRVYKDAISTENALLYLKENKGIHFDPKLVDLFIEDFDLILAETKNV